MRITDLTFPSSDGDTRAHALESLRMIRTLDRYCWNAVTNVLSATFAATAHPYLAEISREIWRLSVHAIQSGGRRRPYGFGFARHWCAETGRYHYIRPVSTINDTESSLH